MRTLLLAAAIAVPGLAQAPQAAPDLAWMHGEWTGTATIFARSAIVSLSVAPVLAGTATGLSYRATIPASGGQPAFAFEGRGTYRVAVDGKVMGNWSDSQGNFHPLAGRVTGTSMAITWGEPRTEIGHSTYILGSDGKLVVTDAAIGKGAPRVFSTQSYVRKR